MVGSTVQVAKQPPVTKTNVLKRDKGFQMLLAFSDALRDIFLLLLLVS